MPAQIPSEDDPMPKRDDVEFVEPETGSGAIYGGEISARDNRVEPVEQLDEPQQGDGDRFELRRLPGRFGKESYIRRLVR